MVLVRRSWSGPSWPRQSTPFVVLVVAALVVPLVSLVAPSAEASASNGRIGFSSERTGQFVLYSMLSDGSSVQSLSTPGAGHIDWSPDGSEIVYEQAGTLYVANADGTGRVPVTTGYRPDWSPDGTQLAYSRNDDIWTVASNGSSAPVQLTGDGVASSDDSAAWSPDGTKIAFQSYRTGDPEIHVMDADGGNLSRLTTSPGVDWYAAWSPDGTKIAFTTYRDGNSEVYVMNSDGTGATNLTNSASSVDEFPAWSPDGTALAFASTRDGNFEIYTMNADGTGVTRLTNSPGRDFFPDWQPVPETNYTLQVSTAGTGTGSVTSTPAGIACGSDCTESYSAGTEVTLTAAPGVNSTVGGWSGGGCTGSGATCTVTMSQARSVTVTFDSTPPPNTHALSIEFNITSGLITPKGHVVSSPAGLVDCTDSCTVDLPEGTTLSLAASADPGFFTGWSGAGCKGVLTCAVTLDQDRTITAGFSWIRGIVLTQQVAVTGTGTGRVTSTPAGIDCPTVCQTTFELGDTIALTAQAEPGSVFNRWIGACESTSPVCEVLMDGAPVPATAVFDATSYRLDVTKSGAGSGSVTSDPAGIDCGTSCEAAFSLGETVTLTATPDPGSTFSGWDGGCAGKAPTCTVTMSHASSVDARFGLEPTGEGSTSLVSVAYSGTNSGNGLSTNPDISDSGRHVAFFSQASDLLPGGVDTNGTWDLFVRDVVLGTTVRANVAADGTQDPLGVSNQSRGVMSGDGSLVVFTSESGDLASPALPDLTDTSSCYVYLRDLVAGTTDRVDLPGGDPNDCPQALAISDGGEYLVYRSTEDDLVPGQDPDGADDVFRTKISTGATDLVSVGPNGEGEPVGSNRQGVDVAITADGRHVSFQFRSSLLATDTNGSWDAYLADLVSGDLEVLSVRSDGTTGQRDECAPAECQDGGTPKLGLALTDDGQRALFTSTWQLTPSDSGTLRSAYLRDRAGATTSLVGPVERTYADDLTPNGSEATMSSLHRYLSSDTNNFEDIWLRATPNGPFELVSQTWSGGIGNSHSDSSRLSHSGRFVAFQSFASNMAPGDSNTVGDIFLRDRLGVSAGYDLDVTVNGPGSGTVTSAPAGIDCPGTCTAGFDTNTEVTLTAQAHEGSTIGTWTGGGCAGSAESCTVSMTEAQSVTVSFTRNAHTLDVVKAGTGSGTVSSTPAGIDCGTDCSEVFDEGTEVTLTAVADAGSTVSWSKVGCSGTSCTVSMTENRTVTVTFTRNAHTLDVVKAGTGSGTVSSTPAGIDCGTDCSEVFDEGTEVTLTAVADTGSTIGSWIGGGCSGAGGTCIVDVSEATSVTVTFADVVVPDSDLTISVSGEQYEEIGRDVTYEVVVTNDGPATAHDVSVTADVLAMDPGSEPGGFSELTHTPARSALAGATPTTGTCTWSRIQALCSLGTVTSGESVKIQVVVSAGPIAGDCFEADQNISSCYMSVEAGVEAEGGDPNPVDNTATSWSELWGFACTIVGTPSADSLAVATGGDVICGLGGNDTITASTSTRSAWHVYGGSGNDTVLDSLADFLRGGRVAGQEGNDTIMGSSSGRSIVDYGGAPGPVSVNLSTGVATGSDGTDTLSNVNYVEGSAYGDVLTGSSSRDGITGESFYRLSHFPWTVEVSARGSDIIDGAGGSDTINPGCGDDVVRGGGGDDAIDAEELIYCPSSGNDSYDGGTGSDSIVYSSTEPVNVNLAQGHCQRC